MEKQRNTITKSSAFDVIEKIDYLFYRYRFWIQQTLSSIQSYHLHLLTMMSLGTPGTLLTSRQSANIHLTITFKKILYIQLFW